jgi:hypothetical protein
MSVQFGDIHAAWSPSDISAWPAHVADCLPLHPKPIAACGYSPATSFLSHCPLLTLSLMRGERHIRQLRERNMDDKNKGEDVADKAKGTAGSTLGGAVAGAVAGSALGAPVAGAVIGAVSGAVIGAAKKRATGTRQKRKSASATTRRGSPKRKASATKKRAAGTRHKTKSASAATRRRSSKRKTSTSARTAARKTAAKKPMRKGRGTSAKSPRTASKTGRRSPRSSR